MTKAITRFLIIICVFTMICGCSTNQEKKEALNREELLDRIMWEDNYIIVDVRTPEEYEDSHVIDAINIPYDTIDATVDLDKSKTILVYCQSGRRSKIAYDVLEPLGYEVYDLGAYDTVPFDKK